MKARKHLVWISVKEKTRDCIWDHVEVFEVSDRVWSKSLVDTEYQTWIQIWFPLRRYLTHEAL